MTENKQHNNENEEILHQMGGGIPGKLATIKNLLSDPKTNYQAKIVNILFALLIILSLIAEVKNEFFNSESDSLIYRLDQIEYNIKEIKEDIEETNESHIKLKEDFRDMEHELKDNNKMLNEVLLKDK